ncbi:MAG: hypothetical protein PHI97_03155 [Desulfobulbus sp.]|nr:hypothetical protein [Desulfobulbus sp.]
MLIPREKPHIEGLNSYYLHLERFIEHLQGEIGSGGVYCVSPGLEMLAFFNEEEIISSTLKEKDGNAAVIPSFEIVRSRFYSANFVVKAFYLDQNAIYYWAQMPSFQRAKARLRSTEIPLPDLIFRLRMKQFSGFIEVQLTKKPEGGVLFFHEGDRIGGSYTWGKGGMSTSNDDYNTLLSRVQSSEGVFTFGSFVKEAQ